ncbi:ABC transporter ATP-binding protein [Egbenema bharatensis]|uniref:ABC transporter ATP-binding protein n=1 Tax=Egbenema bharatensis TaxID=3463334 RepID=UPI003A8B2CF5
MQIRWHQYQTVLMQYLKPQWLRVLVLLVILLGGTGLQLLNPQLLARFIDTAIAGGSTTTLLQFGVLFLGIAVAIQLLSIAESYLAADIGLRATNQLRSHLAFHCLRLDLSFHYQQPPGVLIERIDGDADRLNDFFARFATGLVGNSLVLLGVLVILFRIDWRVGFVLTSFTLVAFVVVNAVRDVAVPYLHAERQASAELFGLIEERLSGMEDVRSCGATDYVMHRFYERSRHLFPRFVRAQTMGATFGVVSSVVVVCGKAIALGTGIVLFQGGALTIGTVYLLYRYVELLERPIQQLGRRVQELQRAGTSILRIQELLNVRSDIPDRGQIYLPAGALAVCVEQVSFQYLLTAHSADDTPHFALQDLSFTLAPGEVLGLLGRTGSGKTTLTRLLFRLYDSTHGTIYIGDIPLPEIPLSNLRQRVGLVTQEVQLFHASVRDNLTLFSSAIADEVILQALEEVGLGSWYQSLPDGLDTRLAPEGSGLSAGQAQLLAFVRVFLKNPGLVILDEASSRLDPATEQLLEQAMDRLLIGRTAIIIAHRLRTVQRADQILILEQGKPVEYGTRDRLLQDPGSRFSQLLQMGLETVSA